ncbi:hypothetical protein B0T14DRAFT_557169 [Immersiella caudata]|uniref:Prion-inhibition and propagation HeLo domain-containing protein n=1 Tax=Immersiella caudata TaxID=314043 RepID=A0AA39WDZ4_9PEZI|nr:hypothetical protein B0T14DRAFT_557169 [Immersiella caudata]
MAEVVAAKVALSALSFFAVAIGAAFGDDWTAAQRRLYIQYVKLDTLCKSQTTWFTNDLFNEQDLITAAIRKQLVGVESQFKKCSGLMKKYDDIEEKLAKAELKSASKSRESTVASDSDDVKKKSVWWKRLAARDKKRKKRLGKSQGTTAEQTLQMLSVSSDETVVGPADRTASNYVVQVLSAPETDLGALPEEEMVSKILKDESNQAAARQKALGLYNRLRWADHDRKTLLRAIEEIERGTRELDNLLQLRCPRDSGIVFGGESVSLKLGPAMERVDQVQKAMKRLHDVLARSAPSNLQDSPHGFGFSIQISEQPESLAQDLVEELPQDDTDLLKTLPTPTWTAWTIQAHHFKSLEDEKASILFYALTRLRPSPGSPKGSTEVAASLDLHRERESIHECEDHYRICSTIGSPADVHHLVIHKGGPWRQVGSLRDALSAEAVRVETEQRRDSVEAGAENTTSAPSPASEAANQPNSSLPSHPGRPSDPVPSPSPISALSLDITASERLQVARLIVIAFLHTALVCRATEQSPRPEKIFFYQNSDDQQETPGSSRILNPYVSIDFGLSNKGGRGKVPLGTSSGLSKKIVNPVAELGLVLFQIGAGMALDYGVDGRNAVKEARLRMHVVGLRCGPNFADAVALCLDKHRVLYEPVGEEDYRFMEQLRGSLWEMDTAAVA